jgi:hypothetical protein
MAENDQTIRKIDWKSVFPFIHLFRGFRLAIDPSKLVLALAAILMLYIGGRLMDAIWPVHSRAMDQEIARYAAYVGDDFHAVRKSAAEDRIAAIRAAVSRTEDADDLGDVSDGFEDQLDKSVDAAHDAYNKLPAEAKNDDARKARDAAVQRAYSVYAQQCKELGEVKGEGLFIHFINYQIDQVDAAAAAATSLDALRTLDALRNFFFIAPMWAITQHYVYFTIFFAFYVLVMAITGGAITRISAVQVARDEKISVRQALRFSTGKVLSFIFAPLIPIIIVVVIGLVLGVLSMFMSVGYVGGLWSIVVGALFVLALIAGLVMALTSLGLVGGGHLMYPTIAVEGSDSFDAVSRSFSYLYARPWQLIFYSAVALVYGAITYLFVRFFLYLLLYLTHAGVGMFMWGTAYDGTSLMHAMWPAPTSPMNLSYDIAFPVLGTLHDIGAFLIAFWVYLAIAMLGAYAISLYYSSSTIIYYLMRREVDATAIDEVYLEPSDDDFADAQPEPTPAPAPETTTTPDAPTTPENPPQHG